MEQHGPGPISHISDKMSRLKGLGLMLRRQPTRFSCFVAVGVPEIIADPLKEKEWTGNETVT